MKNHPKIGYDFLVGNRECNTQRGLIDQLYIALGSYNFLAYLECFKSYAWSKGHSEPDLSSVNRLTLTKFWSEIVSVIQRGALKTN